MRATLKIRPRGEDRGVPLHANPRLQGDIWRAARVTTTPQGFGWLMLHEFSHYALGLPDLYSVTPEGLDCSGGAWPISVMAANGDPEFDDELARCPFESDYTPSWTLMRGKYDRLPAREGPSLVAEDHSAFRLSKIGPS